MKKIILYSSIASVLLIISCNSDKAGKVKNDSLESAAAADSMLKDALAADTLNGDTVRVADTLSESDSLKK